MSKVWNIIKTIFQSNTQSNSQVVSQNKEIKKTFPKQDKPLK